MLMKVCFEGGQRMVEGLVADARAVGGGISVGCLSDGSQDASRGIVFILHHRNRILDGAKRSRRDRLLSGDCRFHPDQEREQNHLFLHQVCAEFVGEVLEEAADLYQFGVILAMNRADLREKGAQSANLFPGVFVVSLLDVGDHLRDRFELPVFLYGGGRLPRLFK